jgi:Tol biopolymer transport system component/DNA-binding winged helix-turn-helix (wHTH) protein
MSRHPKTFYEFGQFRLDAAEQRLWRDDEEIQLAPKAFGVLLMLVRESGHTLPKDDFMREVWSDSFVEEKNLTDNISILRHLLGDDAREPKYIKTVPRRGYRFVASVTEVCDDDDAMPASEEHVILEERTRAHIIIEEEPEATAPPGHLDAEPLGATRAVSPNASTRARPSNRRQTMIVALGSLFLIFALAAAAFWLRPSRANSKSAPPAPPAKFSAARVMPLMTSPEDEFDPALSPDGKLLAFSAKEKRGGSIHIYVKQIDTGGTPLRLTREPVRGEDVNAPLIRDGSAAWSPDGRYIAYVRGSKLTEESGVYVIPALGGVARKLLALTELFGGAGLDWSPDGKSLLIPLSNSPQGPFALHLLSVDTLELKRLTQPPADYHGDFRAVFSPDGGSVAFNRAKWPDAAELFVVSVEGGEARQLTFDNRRTLGAAWTPDGNWIVFASNRAGSYSLWKITLAGGAPEPVATGLENAYDPSVSAHANRLAYTQILTDTNIWRLDLQTPTGRAQTRLISSTRKDDNPSLSPDGKRIAFESDRTGAQEIWVCDVDGANPTQLTTLDGPAAAANPRWSPDGRRIVFESRPAGLADLYVVSSDGGESRRLTDHPSHELAPSWSVDGRVIYFASNRGGDWQVWKMPSTGGEAVQVTSKGGFEAHESPDGKFLYYNKYGWNTRGLFRLPTAGGEESMVIDIAQRDSFGSWVATNEGIYFIDREQFAQLRIEYFDLATRRTKELVSLDHDPSVNPGLIVSPDGRWFIFSLLERNSHDIMLLENLLPASQ